MSDEEETPEYVGLGSWGQLSEICDDGGPPSGPILEVDDRGRVGLYLERLSGDRETADRAIPGAEHVWQRQMLDALDVAESVRWNLDPHFTRGSAALADVIQETYEDASLGWPLAPHLDRIREAHRALCVEQCKAATEGAR